MPHVTARITTYEVLDGRLTEETVARVMRLNRASRQPNWVALIDTPCSIEIKPGTQIDRDWVAMSGTAPVCIDGVWGGRNYPKIVISQHEMNRALALMDGETA